MSTDIRIALVYQQAGGSEALRTALANAGVVVAIESRADGLDAGAVIAADIDAVVVNLDAELEDLLDEVMERLDGLSQPVIYNDPEASSDLSGWDRARWLRHLSAKVKGGGSLVPPPPPGAQAVPMPVAKPVERAPAVVPMVPVVPVAAPAAEPVPEPKPEATVEMPASADEAAVDLDLLFVATEPGESLVMSSEVSSEPMVDLDTLFEAPEAVASPEPAAAPESEPAPPAAADDTDFDALFMAPQEPAASDTPSLALSDLDALFAEDPAQSQPAAVPAPAAETGNIDSEIDLTALLADFSLDQIPSGGASPEPTPAPAVAEPTQAPTPVPASAQDEVAALSDLGDLDALFAEPVASSAATSSPAADHEADIATLDLGSIELELEPFDTDAPVAAPREAPIASADDSLAVADFDFGFELEPMAGESAPAAAGTIADPLDALFAAPVSASGGAAEIALPDLDRIFVLGGSIGGPEAMKAFLARLPASVPAAFVIAQHMGAEFLQMMAAQLDSVSALSVRFPKAGERLRHGEVVVAPSDQRLRLDSTGHIELQPTTGDSPYSPSIDQLVLDAIERFGDRATLILFSGMGSDALEGARQLIARGGQVWVQERSSCVVASMIDGVKGKGLVRFEGSPTELADRVLEVLS